MHLDGCYLEWHHSVYMLLEWPLVWERKQPYKGGDVVGLALLDRHRPLGQIERFLLLLRERQSKRTDTGRMH